MREPTDHTFNGEVPDDDAAAAKRQVDEGQDDHGNRNAPHDVPIIFGLNERALEEVAVNLHDPDVHARLAVQAGELLHSVWAKHLFGADGALDELFEMQGAIRRGAI